MTRPVAPLHIERSLDDHLPHDADGGWYRAPEIPAAKLSKAIGKYAEGVPAASVLALGDGTVFGSAKEGVLITADMFYSRTSEGTFSIPLPNIAAAKKLSGWPGFGVELTCRDGSTHTFSMTCFEKQQDRLIAFCSSLVADGVARPASLETISANDEPATEIENVPQSDEMAAESETADVVARTTYDGDTSVRDINAGLRLIDVCRRDGFDDAGDLFAAAFQADTEWPLMKDYCQYVGFNARQVDAVFLLTNRRLLLFSIESGAKVFGVEMTKRLIGHLPVPFLDTIAGFFLFSIPRAIYVALRGGKDNIIAQALAHEDERLLAAKPPLRKVQESGFEKLTQTISQVDIGTGVCTGFLDRKFGVSFAPAQLAKSFSVPHDLILPDYDSPEKFEQLLHSIRATLAQLGIDYRLDADGKKLTILPAAASQRAAA
jgi:hypothetical protein